MDFLEPKQEVEVVEETPKPDPEPVVQEPETNYVWLASKNVNLVSEPNGTTVTYIGDIGEGGLVRLFVDILLVPRVMGLALPAYNVAL